MSSQAEAAGEGLDFFELFEICAYLQTPKSGCVMLSIWRHADDGRLGFSREFKHSRQSNHAIQNSKHDELFRLGAVDQDCPVVPLQGTAVDQAGTPEIPSCQVRLRR